MLTIRVFDGVNVVHRSETEIDIMPVGAIPVPSPNPVDPLPSPVPGYGPMKDPFKLEFASGLTSGKAISMNGLTLMTQSPGLGHSLRPLTNLKGFRVELSNEREQWEQDANNKERQRSEVYSKGSNFPQNKDVIVSFAIKIEEGEILDLSNGGFAYINQFHASEDNDGPNKKDTASAPPVGLKLTGYDTIELVTSSATDKYHTDKPESITRGHFTLERGVWHRIVIRIIFNPTKGEVQIWKNGVEVLFVKDIGTSYVDTNGPYWKAGIYRSKMKQKIAILFANLEAEKDGSKKLLSRVSKPLELK